MSTAVLDTNIVSYFLRNDPLAKPYLKFLSRPEVCLAISFQTVGELYEGAFRANWNQAKLAHLEAALESYLLVPWSSDMAREWGSIRTERRHRTISVDDAWIAATARAHGCVLVTHNPVDFEGIAGLPLLTVDAQGEERWLRT